MAKKVSIKDVAQRAGVSTTTVSHVLNAAPGKRINPETRVRVREAADELGYQPNGVARSLRLQRSQTLALVSDKIATTPHAGRIILGAQEAASRHGRLLMLVNSGGDAAVEAQEIQAIRLPLADGQVGAAEKLRADPATSPTRPGGGPGPRPPHGHDRTTTRYRPPTPGRLARPWSPSPPPSVSAVALSCVPWRSNSPRSIAAVAVASPCAVFRGARHAASASRPSR